MAAKARVQKRLYYKIGEACKALGIQPYVLRYWETEFPALSPSKSRSGQRVYSERELEVIRRIKQLLYDEGYTIAGAKKKLEGELSAGTLGEASSAAAATPSAATVPAPSSLPAPTAGAAGSRANPAPPAPVAGPPTSATVSLTPAAAFPARVRGTASPVVSSSNPKTAVMASPERKVPPLAPRRAADPPSVEEATPPSIAVGRASAAVRLEPKGTIGLPEEPVRSLVVETLPTAVSAPAAPTGETAPSPAAAGKPAVPAVEVVQQTLQTTVAPSRAVVAAEAAGEASAVATDPQGLKSPSLDTAAVKRIETLRKGIEEALQEAREILARLS